MFHLLPSFVSRARGRGCSVPCIHTHLGRGIPTAPKDSSTTIRVPLRITSNSFPPHPQPSPSTTISRSNLVAIWSLRQKTPMQLSACCAYGYNLWRRSTFPWDLRADTEIGRALICHAFRKTAGNGRPKIGECEKAGQSACFFHSRCLPDSGMRVTGHPCFWMLWDIDYNG